MRLGAQSGPSHAQLGGFKSRALRAEAPTQRHLYTTEWHRIELAGGSGATATVLFLSDDESVDCERLPSRVLSAELAAKLRSGEWAAVAAASIRVAWLR